ncbi:MAG: hypothetical protein B6244_08355 [Candidatus Cloacimonetes bacterium 4572_55]|nr:MAG: hypothetical protein B6244_08355 [Candidatus Cloacimonetes bacterium 4572_55]
MNRKMDYDVIVVGAGPAGSTAAQCAAEQNVSVLLLEKDREIGVPVRCAEGISGRSLRQFVDPTMNSSRAWIGQEIQGARLIAPDGHYVDIFDDHIGYVLERRIFDRYLAQLAAESGAHVRTNCEVDGLLFDERNFVSGVRIRRGKKSERIQAKVVIGCDGVESRIGYWAGLKTTLRPKDMESCYQYTAAHPDINENLCQFYVGSNYAPGGYAWVFPKGKGIANIGLGISGGQSDLNKNAKQILDQFMSVHFPKAEILSAICGGVPVALFMKRMVSDGIMLAGDAAHQVNTMTGGGIASGMFGGREAGRIAAEAVIEDDVSCSRLSNYHDRWEKVQGKKLRRYDRLAQAVEKIDDETFNRTCTLLQKIDPKELTLGTVFKTALKHEPKLLVEVAKIFFHQTFS